MIFFLVLVFFLFSLVFPLFSVAADDGTPVLILPTHLSSLQANRQEILRIQRNFGSNLFYFSLSLSLLPINILLIRSLALVRPSDDEDLLFFVGNRFGWIELEVVFLTIFFHFIHFFVQVVDCSFFVRLGFSLIYPFFKKRKVIRCKILNYVPNLFQMSTYYRELPSFTEFFDKRRALKGDAYLSFTIDLAFDFKSERCDTTREKSQTHFFFGT